MTFWIIVAIVIIVLGVVAYGVYIAFSPPCQESTISDGDDPKPPPAPPTSPMETFRLAWDSEARADLASSRTACNDERAGVWRQLFFRSGDN